MLAILDGWGISAETRGNAVLAARTPTLDKLFAEHPNETLQTSGLAVGLPAGQMGNSEVGHLNIGAGRTVLQSLTRIDKSIDDGDFFENPVLMEAINNVKSNGSSLHLFGLVSDGGVHSQLTHLYALLEMAKKYEVKEVFVHAFLDGRDTPPQSATKFLDELEAEIKKIGVGKIASVSGRYYAMDRDNRWEREKLAYDMLTLGGPLIGESAEAAVLASYVRRENDEFVKPTSIAKNGETPKTVKDGDSIVFFNFRPDRARELTRTFTKDDFSGFERKVYPKNLYFVTMTEYDATFDEVHIAFPPEDVKNTLGEYIAGLGLKQLRIAETEKYAHVTFFFNGGVEAPNENEDRILIPSPKVATYDLQPEMSAYKVADKVAEEIRSEKYDLIILNFANMDMVGHTAVFDAVVKAIEAVDRALGQVVEAITDVRGQLVIIADHGNSEQLLADDGKPFTAHTTNPVPIILFRPDDENISFKEGGALSDVAPTLLDLMNLPIPKEMTGHSLIEEK
jgi:2,3-bisphosphoglycerate-independent phosphoglycerate mutase